MARVSSGPEWGQNIGFRVAGGQGRGAGTVICRLRPAMEMKQAPGVISMPPARGDGPSPGTNRNARTPRVCRAENLSQRAGSFVP